MKKSPIRLIIALLAAGTIAITQTGCNENTLIDSKVAPNLNNINVSSLDTFTIIANTVYDDSVNTSLSITGLPIYHAIGTINADDYFGKTNAGIYMQIVPTSASPSATIFSNMDSMILIVPYSGYIYGDSSMLASNQKISVYQMANNIKIDTPYYAFTNTGYDPTKLWGSTTVNIHSLWHDSVSLYGQNRRPMLHIKLNNQFLTDIQNASINYGTDYPTFLSNFKGMYIGPGPDSNQAGQSLPYVQLDGADTFSQAGVLVFYHTSIDTPKVFQFPFSITYCGHYNNIIRNYSGTPAASHIKYVKYIEPNTPDDIILVQNQPGAALDVRIPYLKNLKNSIPKMVINRAELIITQINSLSSPIYSTPTKLYAVGINDADSGKYDIADRYPTSSTTPLAFLGGYLQTITITGSGLSTQQYIINLPREAINTIIQQRELHLRINGTQDYPGATRLIAGGSTYSDPNYRIKFRIIYSNIK